MDKWRFLVVERGRGWGGDEWYEYHDTYAEAFESYLAINARNPAGPAPDYYIQAQGEIEKVSVGKHMDLTAL